jgi:hypothetical protein
VRPIKPVAPVTRIMIGIIAEAGKHGSAALYTCLLVGRLTTRTRGRKGTKYALSFRALVLCGDTLPKNKSPVFTGLCGH